MGGIKCWVLAGLVMMIGGGAASAAPPRPTLVIAIAVDQFSLELFERYRPSMISGMKRLSEGLVFTGYQSHAATETCPGHSTILSGDHPARTGIVANTWYERTSGSSVYCVQVAGTADLTARGPGRFRVSTFGDWLKHVSPKSRSIAVSGKDRAAIMMAGHHPDGVYWWNDGEGFGTSSYAGPATPQTLAPARAFNRATFESWTKHPPQLWPTDIPKQCAALERPHQFGKLAISGSLPPESAKTVEKGSGYLATSTFNDELRASPIFDPLALAFAEKLIDIHHLGRGPATDLLAVSLSSTDYVGHRYGNGGAESCVQVAAVDVALGEFFDRLDSLRVPYVVVLTADHGAIDAPERLGPPATRIDIAAMLAALNQHLRSKFGLSYDPLAGDDPRQLIIDLAPLDNARRNDVIADVLAWLKTRTEVNAAFTADEIAAAAPALNKNVADLTLAERFHESFDRQRSGDILVAYAEGSTLGIPLASGATVAGHGSPWDYDRRVPILWWWPGVTQKDEPQPMETVDIAPTLAAFIHLVPPAVDGRCVELGQGCPR